MSADERKEMQVKGKQEISADAEQTRPGPVFIPVVDIYETEKDIVMLADMPGVKPDKVDIDLRENALTVMGDISPFEGPNEEDLMVEYEVGKYFRRFTLPDVIDQEKIDAKLKDGVLTLVLPKAEKAKPRKIAITS